MMLPSQNEMGFESQNTLCLGTNRSKQMAFSREFPLYPSGMYNAKQITHEDVIVMSLIRNSFFS